MVLLGVLTIRMNAPKANRRLTEGQIVWPDDHLRAAENTP
jgi:hypothetical protein